MAIYLVFNARDASLLRDANEAGAAGRFDEAARTAADVKSDPTEARALVTIARAHTAARRAGEADAAWAAAARRDPNNWQIHYEWSRALAFLVRDRDAAVRRYARARELNPRLPALP